MQRSRWPVTVMVVTLAAAACGSGTSVRSTSANTDSPTAGTSDATPSAETATTGTQGTLNWTACDDPSAEDPSLECATLVVPLDYDDPTSATIEIAMVRVPATGDRQGAVLFNPGGPGGSGFDPIAQSGSAISPALGLEAFDLIGFDPRGVERSGGIRCVTDQFRDQHLYVDDTPDTAEEQALKDEAESGFIDGCKANYGDTLRFYSTENTARDMDAIRAALGDEQISYLGVSYGTYLGATYATMFPDRVRAMALDSAFEPNGDTIEQQYETQLIGFEGAFDNWRAWCEESADCAFTAADVGARWDALRATLDSTPVPGIDGRLGSNAVMEQATGAALYSESEWPVLATALATAERGDATGLFTLADAYNGRNEDGTFNTLFQSLPVIQCASGISVAPPDDPEALAARLRAAAPRFGADVTGEYLVSQADRCSQLVSDASPIELSYDGDGPIVVVGGANDPATPIRWSEETTAAMGSNARMVTYTGEGHGQLLVSTCVTDIEGALLADLTLPEADTVCEPDPVVDEPQWWDALPVPDGISEVTNLPALAAAVGAAPTQLFSEFRTTALSATDAVAAYTDVLADAGYQQFDAPQSLPIDDVAQGVYNSVDTGATLVVLALGPAAFDDKALQPAKVDVAPNTTVVWLIAVEV